ncbi:hypothetical protein ACOSP7_021563 [Xanthoceras sorbifolium]
MNTGASFNHSSNRAGFGVIISDSDGQVLLAGASPLTKEFNLQTAEDMAVRWGLILSRDFGLLPIEIESDTQEVVKSINSRICPLSDAAKLGQTLYKDSIWLEKFPYCVANGSPIPVSVLAQNGEPNRDRMVMKMKEPEPEQELPVLELTEIGSGTSGSFI